MTGGDFMQRDFYHGLLAVRRTTRAVTAAIVVAIGSMSSAGLVFGQQPGPSFRPIVMIVGCVEAEPDGGFVLERGTEPVVLADRVREEPTAAAALGDRSVQLIGTLDEFGITNHIGHKVRVRGMYIDPATDDDDDDDDDDTAGADRANGADSAAAGPDAGRPRLNLTSILSLSSSCG